MVPDLVQLCQDGAMPKVVDHEQRRAEIARAMWQVIARDGMTAASARTIAAQSGWSLGAVRHYFSSQAQLRRFAAEEMMTATTARIGATFGEQRPGVLRCLAVLEQMLPLDDQRTGEVRVWLALLIEAHTDPALDDIRLLAWDGERRICRMLVADLAARDGVTGMDPLEPGLEAEAATLHLLVDGLTLQAGTSPERMPPTTVQETLHRYVSALASRVAPSGVPIRPGYSNGGEP